MLKTRCKRCKCRWCFCCRAFSFPVSFFHVKRCRGFFMRSAHSFPRPILSRSCVPSYDGTHERDKIGRGKECAERIKNPRHRFTWKNETGKENARQQKHHRHLQRLHLVFSIGPYEQTEAEQRKDIDQR